MDDNDAKKGQNIKVKKGPTKALLEDFPEWHPAQMTDELELYEQTQQQKSSYIMSHWLILPQFRIVQ